MQHGLRELLDCVNCVQDARIPSLTGLLCSSPSSVLQRPAHFGGFGGFNRGPQQSELALGPSVDIEQLQKDLERSQVDGVAAAGACAEWSAAVTHSSALTASFTTLPACLQAALDKLPGELKAQQANAAKVERRLQREKGGWVQMEGRPSLPREFVQARSAAAPDALRVSFRQLQDEQCVQQEGMQPATWLTLPLCAAQLLLLCSTVCCPACSTPQRTPSTVPASSSEPLLPLAFLFGSDNRSSARNKSTQFLPNDTPTLLPLARFASPPAGRCTSWMCPASPSSQPSTS